MNLERNAAMRQGENRTNIEKLKLKIQIEESKIEGGLEHCHLLIAGAGRK